MEKVVVVVIVAVVEVTGTIIKSNRYCHESIVVLTWLTT